MTAEAGVEARIAQGPFKGARVLALPAEAVPAAAVRVMARVRFTNLESLDNPVVAISANLTPGNERYVLYTFRVLNTCWWESE